MIRSVAVAGTFPLDRIKDILKMAKKIEPHPDGYFPKKIIGKGIYGECEPKTHGHIYCRILVEDNKEAIRSLLKNLLPEERLRELKIPDATINGKRVTFSNWRTPRARKVPLQVKDYFYRPSVILEEIFIEAEGEADMDEVLSLNQDAYIVGRDEKKLTLASSAEKPLVEREYMWCSMNIDNETGIHTLKCVLSGDEGFGGGNLLVLDSEEHYEIRARVKDQGECTEEMISSVLSYLKTYFDEVELHKCEELGREEIGLTIKGEVRLCDKYPFCF